MTKEGFRDYVDFLRSQDEISYDVYSGLIDGIDTLEQEPCEIEAVKLQQAYTKGFEDCRQAVLDQTYLWSKDEFLRVTNPFDYLRKRINSLPPVTPQPKTGHCKDCKYFEYDSVAKVDGIPLIVAHEICSKWGNGCKTKEDGYCFLFEPQEGSKK